MNAGDCDRDWEILTGRGRLDNPEEAIPPPPWQLRSMDFISVGAKFDPAAVRAFLPPRFHPVPDCTGGVYVYDAPHGWGVTPYSAALGWLDVEGFDAPDGSKARYSFLLYYSGRGYRGFSTYGIGNFVDSHARHTIRDGIAEGFAGPVGGGDRLHIAIRLKPGDPPTSSGIHYYVSERAGQVYAATAVFSYRFFGAEPLALDLNVPPDDPIAALKPKELLWAGHIPDGVVTLNAPVLVSGTRDLVLQTNDTEYLNIFGTIGLGAILVDANWQILFMNPTAESMLGDGLRMVDRTIRATDPAVDSALRKRVASVMERGGHRDEGEALVVPRPSGRKPLVLQFARLERSGGLAEGWAAMLLIADPVSSNRADPARILQLFGLTPAEARVAALVGSGLSPREAGKIAGNTESTVRYMLKQVYEKLDIGRQAELARLVARLTIAG